MVAVAVTTMAVAAAAAVVATLRAFQRGLRRCVCWACSFTALASCTAARGLPLIERPCWTDAR